MIEMNDRVYKKLERKYCLLTSRQVDVAFIIESWLVADGSTEERTVGMECPESRKCAKKRTDCRAVDPDRGKDPFTVERNLLKDLW